MSKSTPKRTDNACTDGENIHFHRALMIGSGASKKELQMVVPIEEMNAEEEAAYLSLVGLIAKNRGHGKAWDNAAQCPWVAPVCFTFDPAPCE